MAGNDGGRLSRGDSRCRRPAAPRSVSRGPSLLNSEMYLLDEHKRAQFLISQVCFGMNTPTGPTMRGSSPGPGFSSTESPPQGSPLDKVAAAAATQVVSELKEEVSVLMVQVAQFHRLEGVAEEEEEE